MAYLSNRQAPLCGADPFGLESLHPYPLLAGGLTYRLLVATMVGIRCQFGSPPCLRGPELQPSQ